MSFEQGGYGDSTPLWEQHDAADDAGFQECLDRMNAQQPDDKAALEAKLQAAFSTPVGASASGQVDASGGAVDMQQVAETGETVANAVLPYVTPLVETVVPEAGDFVNAVQGIYHVGAAAYDAGTGDRDGAVAQGAQALGNAIGFIPGVKDMIGGADMMFGAAGGGLKLGGESMKDMPQSTGDLLSGLAVGATNAAFGADDSNWFAAGDRPQGNRRDEIGCGLGTLLDSMPFHTGDLARRLSPNFDKDAGNAVGDVFDTPANAPTTGAGPKTAWQRGGQQLNDLWTGLFD